MSALWGKLAAAILMQKWDDALEDLNRLKEIIDSKVRFLLVVFRPRFIRGIKPWYCVWRVFELASRWSN
jgi:hypothetical protein